RRGPNPQPPPFHRRPLPPPDGRGARLSPLRPHGRRPPGSDQGRIARLPTAAVPVGARLASPSPTTRAAVQVTQPSIVFRVGRAATVPGRQTDREGRWVSLRYTGS